MKEKVITIKPKGMSQKQYSSFLLELNLMKKAWKPYGVNVEISAPGLRKIILFGRCAPSPNHFGRRPFWVWNCRNRVTTFCAPQKLTQKPWGKCRY